MITYWTSCGATPALSSAPRIATPPRSAPEKSLRDPCRRPIGVRAPATTTGVRSDGADESREVSGRSATASSWRTAGRRQWSGSARFTVTPPGDGQTVRVVAYVTRRATATVLASTHDELHGRHSPSRPVHGDRPR